MTSTSTAGCVVCEHVTSSVVRMDPDGTGSGREVLATHYDGKELNSPNDVVVKSDGAIYFTDPTYGRMPGFGIEREQDLDFQGVYRIPPGGGDLQLLVDDFAQPNGLCFSADESTLYVNDTDARAHPGRSTSRRRDARRRARARRGHRVGRASRSATSSTG